VILNMYSTRTLRHLKQLSTSTDYTVNYLDPSILAIIWGKGASSSHTSLEHRPENRSGNPCTLSL